MRNLIIGSGLTLVALGGAVAADTQKPTAAGAVTVTENKCPAPGAQEHKQLTSADAKHNIKIKIEGPAVNADYKHKDDGYMKVSADSATAKADYKETQGVGPSFMKIDSTSKATMKHDAGDFKHSSDQSAGRSAGKGFEKQSPRANADCQPDYFLK